MGSTRRSGREYTEAKELTGRFKSRRPDFGNNSSSPDFGGELFLVWRQGFAIGPHALG
jgi:hypothetical protein